MATKSNQTKCCILKRAWAGSTALLLVWCLSSGGGLLLKAQQSATEPQFRSSPVRHGKADALAQAVQEQKPHTDPGYILGSGDQISVHVVDFEEIRDKPIPIDLTGRVRLPLVGSMLVSGLTTAQVEAELSKRLKTYLLRPDVSVLVTEFRSQPVAVIGAVKNPGVQQVQGRKTLVEVLSLAGGLETNAGSILKITRRLEWGRVPLAHAADDPTGLFSVAEISLKSMFEAKHPEENVLVKPNDVISVPRADTIYVIGQVQKSGGYVLNDHEEITVLQALSMAGGLDRVAQPQNARILRRLPEASSRTEIPVDLKKILAGKTPDIRMQAEDVLFVPNSVPKHAALRALDVAVQMGTGVVIWGR